MKTDNKEEMLSSLLLAIRDLVLGSLDFEWLSLLPEATKIVTDFYKLNMSMEEVKELSIQKMIEIVLVQYECEKRTNEGSKHFFYANRQQDSGNKSDSGNHRSSDSTDRSLQHKELFELYILDSLCERYGCHPENSPATTAGEES